MSSALRWLSDSWYGRLTQIVAVVVFHLSCYYLVNYINHLRAPAALWNLETAIDGWVLYLPWTWIFYYGAHPYVIIWAAVLVWRLPRRDFSRIIKAYIGMIVLGDVVQLLIPAAAPWPEQLESMQRFMHSVFSFRPYACLPSMHVSLSILPACLSLVVLRSRWLKILSLTFALLITFSTVTMKEHFFLDAVTGVVLGVLAFLYWYWGHSRVPVAHIESSARLPKEVVRNESRIS